VPWSVLGGHRGCSARVQHADRTTCWRGSQPTLECSMQSSCGSVLLRSSLCAHLHRPRTCQFWVVQSTQRISCLPFSRWRHRLAGIPLLSCSWQSRSLPTFDHIRPRPLRAGAPLWGAAHFLAHLAVALRRVRRDLHNVSRQSHSSRLLARTSSVVCGPEWIGKRAHAGFLSAVPLLCEPAQLEGTNKKHWQPMKRQRSTGLWLRIERAAGCV